jgi:hypothetical protein
MKSGRTADLNQGAGNCAGICTGTQVNYREIGGKPFEAAVPREMPESCMNTASSYYLYPPSLRANQNSGSAYRGFESLGAAMEKGWAEAKKGLFY